MSTARDIIRGAMRLIGAIATGETPTADELSDGLATLNDMVDSWSNESLLVYADTVETFSLVNGKRSYTMGPTGDFGTVRPQKINQAFIVIDDVSPSIDIPIEIINQEQFARISLKDTPSTLPTKLFPDLGYPFATMNVWPNPSAGHKLKLYSWKPFVGFTNASDIVSLPPGYKKALKYGLALELAPEFGRPVDPSIAAGFLEAKENIKRMNIKTQFLSIDPALMKRGRFNILTGE